MGLQRGTGPAMGAHALTSPWSPNASASVSRSGRRGGSRGVSTASPRESNSGTPRAAVVAVACHEVDQLLMGRGVAGRDHPLHAGAHGVPGEDAKARFRK
jgi:hypothetical protein